MPYDVLIVDDEADIRALLSGILRAEGYETRVAADSDSALAAMDERIPHVVFLDILLLDGLELLDKINNLYPKIQVVMISGHGNDVLSAMKRGAYDFIEKPFKGGHIILIVERAMEISKLRRELLELRNKAIDSSDFVGNSFVINHLRQIIEKVAPTNSRIMITGPYGSGKEMTARMIHTMSRRSNGAFVVFNAARIRKERMEIELFGIEMSGEPRVGALEEAHGGTLYLNEVADMPREIQGRILRVLTDQQFERVGGVKRIKVDVRIISSTAQNLTRLISSGLFREDLFNRLSVVPIYVPPLAEHREDIPVLVEYFIKQIALHVGIMPRMIGDGAMAAIQAHHWPGNVRQLRNNIERLLIMSREDKHNDPISFDLLPSEITDCFPHTISEPDQHIMALPIREARELFEREYLTAQIRRFSGNISRTAEFIGMERSALHRKLKFLGL